jgi:peptidoglycan/xylan/chitin deacetylase (PgdA/CDA1 family)
MIVRFFAVLLVLGFGVSCDRHAKAPRARVVVVEETEDAAVAEDPPAAPVDPSIPELKVNKSAQVGILCYHDFIPQVSNSQMRINIEHFRRQLQSIQDAKLPVISLTQFILWRRGEMDIPDSCVMLTVDDGYNSTFHLAHPLLKHYGFPYSIFLYKNYVNGGGRALTTSMINQMLQEGAEVGSHSVSHPFNIAKIGSRTPEQYEQFLVNELGGSKQFLEDLLMRPVPTYAHPGGTYSEQIIELGKQFGYELMFSVNPAKAKWDTPAGLIPRYVVLGDDPQDRNFRAALSFRGISEGDLGRQLIGPDGQMSTINTYPQPNATIAERSPLISVDVSKLTDIDPSSIHVTVAGLGQLPANYDPSSGRITCQVRDVLRQPDVHVHVSLRRKGQDKPDIISWKFLIDLAAHYLPDDPIKNAVKAVVVPEEATAPPK